MNALNPHEPTPADQQFRSAPVSPEVADARDSLQTVGNAILDWCIENPFQRAPAVRVESPRDGVTQVTIDILDEHQDGEFLIIQRDSIAAIVGQVTDQPEEPFSIAHSLPGQEPDSQRNFWIVFPTDGVPKVRTSYEKEKFVPPGAYVYSPLEPYTSRRATADDIAKQRTTLTTAAEAAGIPPAVFR